MRKIETRILVPFAILFLSSCTVVRSANVRFTPEGQATLELMALEDRREPDEAQKVIVKCGGIYKSAGLDEEGNAQFSTTFRFSSPYEMEQTFRCADSAKEKPLYEWRRSDGIFQTNYLLSIVVPKRWALGLQELRIKMPATISDTKIRLADVNTSSTFEKIGDDLVRVLPKFDLTSVLDDCGIAFDIDKLSGYPKLMDSAQRKCFDQRMDNQPEKGALYVEIRSTNNKFDLAIWVAILGAILGSGIIVNLINLAVRKNSRSG